MKKITTLTTNRNDYVITTDGKMFYAFNSKDIDENGKLTKAYNGLTAWRTESLAETIDGVIFQDTYADFRDTGLTEFEALEKTYKKLYA